MIRNLEAKVGCKVLVGAENVKSKLKRKVAGMEPIEKGLMLLASLAVIYIMKKVFIDAGNKTGEIVNTATDGLYK